MNYASLEYVARNAKYFPYDPRLKAIEILAESLFWATYKTVQKERIRERLRARKETA